MWFRNIPRAGISPHFVFQNRSKRLAVLSVSHGQKGSGAIGMEARRGMPTGSVHVG